jgi:hypothetical protein
VPAIRDFLALNQDLNFAAIGGGELTGQTSMRTALINGLQQIGGPEATAHMLQTLQTTTVPSEIELLARNLEQQVPGQYRQEVLHAANDVLAMVSKGQLPGWDVGSLFKVFQNPAPSRPGHCANRPPARGYLQSSGCKRSARRALNFIRGSAEVVVGRPASFSSEWN